MPKKIVLAYSGGLDTSVILKWLQLKYDCEVITFTADLGQGEELAPVKSKASSLGVKNIIIENLQEEFVRDYVFPMFRANTIYEGTYLLGTAIARPLIAKRQVEIAKEAGADTVAHGATGKGNDQIRFELGYYAINPKIKVIAPWREWELSSRNELIKFAEKYQIPIPKDKKGEPPFSTDANLLHTSSEGKILEDPWIPAPEHVFSRTKSLDGIGRVDMVENRFIGMKSRGIYETPGGTILLVSRRAIESITIDIGQAHMKDEVMPKYAELIYNGMWFSSERKSLQESINHTQKNVSGDVKIKIYKGNVMVMGRKSKNSLYNASLASFDKNSDYSQQDAEGFIKINALKFRK